MLVLGYNPQQLVDVIYKIKILFFLPKIQSNTIDSMLQSNNYPKSLEAFILMEKLKELGQDDNQEKELDPVTEDKVFYKVSEPLDYM